MNWTRRSSRILLGTGILVAVVAGLLLWRARRAVDAVPLRVGEDTTRITEPLRSDGSVDYLAALNAESLPPSGSNAAIPLLRALGTRSIVGDAARVLELLGAPPDLPEAGLYVEPGDDVELPEPGTSPARDAAVRSWVAENGEALDLFIEASRCEHFAVPIVRDSADGGLMAALPPWSILYLGEVLMARADLARADGKLQQAWGDLRALLRMHVLLDEAPGLMGRLVAHSLGGMALDRIDGLLSDGAIPPKVIDAAIEVLRALPKPRPLISDVDRFERLFVLDLQIGMLRRSGQLSGSSPVSEQLLDPNICLQRINMAFDRAISEMHRGGSDRKARLSRVSEEERQRLREQTEALTSSLGRFRLYFMAAEERRDLASRWQGDNLAQLALSHVVLTLGADDQTRMRRRLTLVALALRRHADGQGSFPASLEELVPEGLPAIPDHPLTGLPFPYERTEAGCRVGGRNPQARLEEGLETAIELTR